MRKLKPKVVVLLIGTNNVSKAECSFSGSGAVEIADAVSKLIEKLKRIYPKSPIILMGILPMAGKRVEGNNFVQTQVNPKLAELADGKTVFWLDLKFMFPIFDNDIDVMRDELHPENQGFERIAQGLDPLLSNLLKTKSQQK